MHLRNLNIPYVGQVISWLAMVLLSLTLVASPAVADYNAGIYKAELPTVSLSALPPEARVTLTLIKQGGPFPYARDGVVFGNYEKILPKKKRGYYHEYTVRTPGVRSRGARRIVCGQQAECFYTDDHYQSFRLIRD